MNPPNRNSAEGGKGAPVSDPGDSRDAAPRPPKGGDFSGTTEEQRRQWREAAERRQPGCWRPSAMGGAVINDSDDSFVTSNRMLAGDVTFVYACTKHPMKAERDALRAENERLKAALTEACDIAERRGAPIQRIAELRKAGEK